MPPLGRVGRSVAVPVDGAAWVGTSPFAAGASPRPGSAVRPFIKKVDTAPRLPRSSSPARRASQSVSPPMFLTANSAFWPSSRAPPSTTSGADYVGRLAVKPDRTAARAIEGQSGRCRALGQRAAIPGIPISFAPAPPPPAQAVAFADRPPKDSGAQGQPARVGARREGAARDRRRSRPAWFAAGGPRAHAVPFRGLALRGVRAWPAAPRLPPLLRSAGRERRSVTLHMARDTARAIILGIRLGLASVAARRPTHASSSLSIIVWDQLARPVAQTASIIRIEPRSSRRSDRRLGF